MDYSTRVFSSILDKHQNQAINECNHICSDDLYTKIYEMETKRNQNFVFIWIAILKINNKAE